MKRAISVLLTLAICIGLCAVAPAMAAGSVFDIQDGILKNYRGPGGDVTIPSGVTVIGSYAFSNNKAVTRVTIPEGVTRIEESAFWRCSNLADVTLPSSLTTIESFAFNGCGSLKSIAIPEGTASIEHGAFSDCSYLANISLPASVKYFGGAAFNNTPWLEALRKRSGDFIILNGILIEYQGSARDVTIPSNVTAIGANSFSSYRELKSVTIPDSVTHIDENAFYECENLERVSFPAHMDRIKSRAFGHCSSLKSITLPKGITSVEPYLFYRCSALTDVVFLDKITEIGKSAFDSCTSLKSFTIPSGVKSIPESSFSHCTSLTDIHIPSGITDIGESAFQYCTSLNNIVIPAGVTSIGEWAFGGCTSLNNIVIPDSVVSIESSTFFETPWFDAMDDFSIVNGILLKYKGPGGNVTIPSGVTQISDGAFLRCTDMTSITIPQGVTFIGRSAFQDCDHLTKVVFPEGLISIGDYAFVNCMNLRKVIFPSTVTSIGEWAFFNHVRVSQPGKISLSWHPGTDRSLSTRATFWGYSNSYAEIWAKEYGYIFYSIGKARYAFVDVASDAYYADPVAWAVDQKITAGTTATTFSPEQTCTTGQILTFLWRAKGSPQVTSVQPFADTSENDYFYQPALWAKDLDMISGSTLSPNTPCTRASTVRFIWQAAGKPAAAAKTNFTDVPSGADYAAAVAWAVESGVTSGTSVTTFSPNATCTRGQIVTFLYRAFADSTALANKDEHEGMIYDPAFGWMTQTDYNNMISVQEGGH